MAQAEYESLGIVEPRRYWRRRITTKRPLWLINPLHCCIAGWWLETFRWDQQADGHWRVETCWQRRKPWASILGADGKTVQRLQIYGKVRFWTALRLLLWWALSYPIDKED